EPSRPTISAPTRRSASAWTGPMNPPPTRATRGRVRTTSGEPMTTPLPRDPTPGAAGSETRQPEQDAHDQAHQVRPVGHVEQPGEPQQQPEKHNPYGTRVQYHALFGLVEPLHPDVPEQGVDAPRDAAPPPKDLLEVHGVEVLPDFRGDRRDQH